MSFDSHKSQSSSFLLASAAREAKDILITHAKRLQCAPGSTIAYTLLLISKELASEEFTSLLPVEDIESRSHRALLDLLDICTFPTCSRRIHPKSSSRDVHDELLLLRYCRTKEMNNCIRKFFSKDRAYIEEYGKRFSLLHEAIAGSGHLESTQSDSLRAACARMKPAEGYVYDKDIRKHLFQALETHSKCRSSHFMKDLTQDSVAWHQARMSLWTGQRISGHRARFDLIAAASADLKLWQNFALAVSLRPKNQRKYEESSNHSEGQSDEDWDEELAELVTSAICKILEQPMEAQIRLELDSNCRLRRHVRGNYLPYRPSPGPGHSLSSLLRKCELTLEQKSALAFAVARSSWEFYDSDLMRVRWSSEDLWFRPVVSRDSTNKVALNAYISFPFGKYNAAPEEYIPKDRAFGVPHRYPRIFSLGIILLEIGLGEPLELEPFSSSIPELCKAGNIANECLKNLNERTALGPMFKDAYSIAVQNCLNSDNFNVKDKEIQRLETKNPEKYRLRSISERRNALYRHVVAPLQLLAEVAFKKKKEFDVPLVNIQTIGRRPSAVTTHDALEKFWYQSEAPSLYSGTSDQLASEEKWFSDLQSIASVIALFRREKKVRTPLRIAILDTGCNLDLKIFTDSHKSCLRDWKDFAGETPSPTPIDSFGHGTLMTRLAMQAAPDAVIYIARVAESTEQLKKSVATNEERIAKAIEHAGLEWRADVVSMSFGFPNSSQQIADAISLVNTERLSKVIFVASAGNTGPTQGVAFPARHSSVIAIYAATYQGNFLSTNPAQSGIQHAIVGTFGDHVPEWIIKELQSHFPQGDFTPGTSIAAAVASGIVASTLSYITALPQHFKNTENACDTLRSSKVMEEMLKQMAVLGGGNKYHKFVDPLRFWRDNPSHDDKFGLMCTAIRSYKELANDS